MYELAKTIQRDRRRQACLQRLAHSVRRATRSVAVGPYLITVARQPRAIDRAA